MANIAGSRETAEIAVSIAKMLNKISMSAFNGRPPVSKLWVRLKKRVLGEDNVVEVDHLLVRHRRG
jgi:hypothetical protein